MKNPESLRKLLHAMNAFSTAYHNLLNEIGDYECFTGTDVNSLPGFTEYYPFDTDLHEIPVDRWVDAIVDNVRKESFKILNYEYLNTGGNTMVGVFTVWIPQDLRTVYMLTNEEGCNMSAVDYISNDVEIENYEDVTIDTVEWDDLAGTDRYFELYKHCLNEYTKSDCRYFGCTRQIPYHLLSLELQSKVDACYLEWCEENNGGCVETNGIDIIISPDYDVSIDTDNRLQEIKDFKDFHESTAGVEEFYDEEYILTFAGKTVRLPFMADVWECIDGALKTTIENW